MADNPRIEELRRRVQKDPASIAFAQLAEEHRRAGEYEEAIAVCRTGLEQHPGYLSARVTLGRALLETGQYEDAQAELEYVLRAAPDNLAAIRALAEIHQRREDGDQGPAARDLDTTVDPRSEEYAAALWLNPPPDVPMPDPEALLLEAEPAIAEPDPILDDRDPLIPDPWALAPDPVLTELEAWLAALLADREARR